jgi:glycerophosphoryl diester phosphodiesterase
MKTKFYFLLSVAVASLWVATPLFAQTKVIAHRGYWDCEGSAQNSIAALNKANEAGVYGSEFDVIITPDGVPVINHDDSIGGYHIETTPYRLLKKLTLPNGETLPTLKNYLKAGKKNRDTKLILEIKPHKQEANEKRAVETVVAMVRKAGMEKQVEYISFSLFVCKELVRLSPVSPVAYLNGNMSPGELKEAGLSGLDYHYNVLNGHPQWIREARKAGLTVNVWTVNKPELMKQFIEQGVDYITTDKPVELKALLNPL